MKKQNKKLNKDGTSTSANYAVPFGASIIVALYVAFLGYKSSGKKYVIPHMCNKGCCSKPAEAIKPKRLILKPCESNSLFKKDNTYYYE